MSICIIPARGGSKRIPRKNIRVFHGRPMIEWSIRAAQDSNEFDQIVVSTDDPEIAKISEACGAKVPFMRPSELSDDYTGTVQVISHALTEIEKIWGKQSLICCLYATAPFVQSGDIRSSRILLENSGADYAFPITSFPFPIQRSVKLTYEGRMEMFYPEYALTRSQDLEEAYHDAGQFYWGQKAAWLSGRPIIGPGSSPLVIPRHRVQDIDTPEDWEVAEYMFEAIQKSNPKL